MARWANEDAQWQSLVPSYAYRLVVNLSFSSFMDGANAMKKHSIAQDAPFNLADPRC
jgi:hypothetical protein